MKKSAVACAGSGDGPGVDWSARMVCWMPAFGRSERLFGRRRMGGDKQPVLCRTQDGVALVARGAH